MRYLKGDKVQDIAIALKISRNTVTRYVSSALSVYRATLPTEVNRFVSEMLAKLDLLESRLWRQIDRCDKGRDGKVLDPDREKIETNSIRRIESIVRRRIELFRLLPEPGIGPDDEEVTYGEVVISSREEVELVMSAMQFLEMAKRNGYKGASIEAAAVEPALSEATTVSTV